MPQSPLLVDQLQIEPGTTTYGSRLIGRDTSDGGIQFTDPNVVVSLLQLVGLRNLTGLFIVGRAGDGAPYTSIQDAIDAIPDTSSPAEPSLVVVGPGEYSETLTIDKNGVLVVGMGRPTITSAAGPTVSIEDTALSTPENVVLRDLVIEQTGAGEVCVGITGAGTYASGTVTVDAVPLTAGDLITIGGTNLTAVVGSRTAGSDDFSIDGATEAAIAVEIAEAINDAANSFAATVAASADAAIVTITAVTPGAGGNAITLTVTAVNLTASAATLTGGGSAGSTVGASGILLLDCDLVASGAASKQIDADTVNHVRVEGGTWRGSASDSFVRVNQLASFRVHGVEWVNDLEFAYDSLNDQPSDVTSEYRVTSCGVVGNILSNQVTVGSLVVADCGSTGNVIAGGDTTLEVSHTRIGDLSLDDTLAATLVSTTRGTLTLAGGTPTLAETQVVDTASYLGVALTVSFTVAQPDTNYEVFLSPSVTTDTYAVTAKATSDFTIDSAGGTPATVGYTILRQL